MRYIGMLVVVLAGGLASGQSTPPATPAATPSSFVVEKTSDIPDVTKLERSTQSLTAMREALRAVLSKLDEARRARDVVKLNCVNEKLTQVKGLLRISEQADIALQEAVARREANASGHEYTKVMLAQQKVALLRGDVEKCIGQLAFQADENLSVEVEEPKDLPGGDPTKPRPIDDVLVRPPPASAVR